MGSLVPPQDQEQPNGDFMKAPFDLDSGKYLETKIHKGTWLLLVFSKGAGKITGEDMESILWGRGGGNRAMDLV